VEATARLREAPTLLARERPTLGTLFELESLPPLTSALLALLELLTAGPLDFEAFTLASISSFLAAIFLSSLAFDAAKRFISAS
jgi:hypothetical protein